jgi:uncharacterized membrane protein
MLGIVSTVSSVFLNGYPASTVANLPLVLVTGLVGLFAFVGLILFLVAMYGFSKDYGEHRIFDYLVKGIIWTIIAAVVAGVIIFVVFLLNLASIFPGLNSSTTDPTQVTNSIQTFLSPATAVFSLVGLIWVVFNVKAFKLLGEKSGVPLFRTAAFVLLAGAVVNIGIEIVFAALTYSGSINYNTNLLAAVPGGFVQDIAWLLLAIAFFRIKAPPTQTFTPSKVPTFSGQLKYCPNCGTPNQLDAIYCTRCGQKL